MTDKTRSYFRLCDEFMSHVVEMRTIRLIRKIDASESSEKFAEARTAFMSLIMEEREYKVPSEVLRLREKSSFVEEESHIFEEKILLYRKHVTIDDQERRAFNRGNLMMIHSLSEKIIIFESF